jgi:hypothetical protein
MRLRLASGSVVWRARHDPNAESPRVGDPAVRARTSRPQGRQFDSRGAIGADETSELGLRVAAPYGYDARSVFPLRQ